MTLWTILIYGAVLCWLMPAAAWRPVAMVLMVTWGIGEAWWYLTGDHVSPRLYRAGDCLVMLIVATKRGHWSELLIIPLIFAQWDIYAEPDSYDRWVRLTVLQLLQFGIAGPWFGWQRGSNHFSHGPLRPAESNSGGI